MVLDGAIDPALSNEELIARPGRTASRPRCTPTSRTASPAGQLLLGRHGRRGRPADPPAARRPRRRSRCRPTATATLTEGLATYGIVVPLYVKELLAAADRGAEAGHRAGRGDRLLTLSDPYSSRGPDGYTDNSMAALYAVNCLDHDDYIPSSEVPSHFAEFEKASPTFGRIFAYSLSTCSSWPVQSGNTTKAIARRGCAADRGGRYDARPGHAVRLVQGAGLRAGLRRPGQPRRGRPHRLPAGQRAASTTRSRTTSSAASCRRTGCPAEAVWRRPGARPYTRPACPADRSGTAPP